MAANSKFIYYFFIGFFIVAIIVSLLYYIINQGIFADMLFDRGEVVDQISVSYNLDKTGADEKVMITKYKKDEAYKYYLEIAGRPDLYLELEGFENNVTFCEEEVLELNQGNVAICILGYVGVHSKNLQIVKYQNNKLEACQFVKEDVKTNNIYSDSPNFNIIDYNNDKNLDLAIDYRDYNKNPLEDIERMYYYFDTETCFIYNRMEEINQSNNGTNESGQIN